ncbi:MAG: hypothetical protein KI790_06215 [Cyclobacteriaceae bacterium]|nr:hypothetical protein [Cyclobacteriaceae bacterium HetDA_MAG_MS6]
MEKIILEVGNEADAKIILDLAKRLDARVIKSQPTPGDRMAILRDIQAVGNLKKLIQDPVQWQKDERVDRDI